MPPPASEAPRKPEAARSRGRAAALDSDGEEAAMSAEDGIEVEWQFGADDLAAAGAALRARAADLGLALAEAGDLELLDRYLDTADWSFLRAGYALRVRESGGRAEAALKALGGGAEAGEPLRRREIAQPLGEVSGAGAASFAASGPVADRVRAVAGGRALRTLFALRTRRRVLAVADADGAPLAEAALDETAVEDASGARAASLRRVELELARPGALAAAAPLAEALARSPGFAPAAASKYEAALAAAGLAPPAPPAAAPIAIGPATSLAEAGRAALRGQLALYRWREAAARFGEDASAVRDMRVAARRFRTALAVFGGALPPEARALGDGFRHAAAALGEVRDLDAPIARLRAEAHPDGGDASPLLPAAALLEARREEARARLLAALGSARHERLLDSAEALLRGEAAPDGARPALRALPELLRAAWRRYRRRANRLGPASADGDAHEARLRVKRVRYAAEFVAAPYGPPAVRFAVAARRVQRALGRRQDAAVAAALFAELAREPSLPPASAAAIGALAERERAAALAAAEAFADADRRLRRRWRPFEAALERRAAE